MRGAEAVVFVEKSPIAARALRANAKLLEADGAEICQDDALEFLTNGDREPFDIVFLDPPFGEDLLEGIMQQLEEGGWLSADAWVYLEAERGHVYELPPNWAVHRSMTAGQVACYLVRRTAGQGQVAT